MKRAFTLLELLVVMGIIGALTTMSISSYRALARGMEDRAAIVAVQSFLDLVVQRAQIDRAPVKVYFYDELKQQDKSDGTGERGNGVAVAVRAFGRVTGLGSDSGDTLVMDEFGDLDQVFMDASGLSSANRRSKSSSGATRIYLLDDGAGTDYFDASPSPCVVTNTEPYVVSGEYVDGVQRGSSGGGGSGLKEGIRICAFRMEKGTTPRVGDTYGAEFARRELPDGYYFKARPSRPGRVGPFNPVSIDPDGSAPTVDVVRYRANKNTPVHVGKATGRK